MAEYVGTALYCKFGTTVLSADYRKLTINQSTDKVESTAGNDASKTYLPTFPDTTASIELVAQTGGSVLYAALAPGTNGTLEWGPEGTTSGKQKHTAVMLVDSRTFDSPYADIVTLNASFSMFSGTVTDSVY